MGKTEEAKRKEWIDIAKGIGIIFVVLGHCFVKDTPMHNWIFSFHMPLFFLLSGYCFKPEKYTDIKSVFQTRFKALMLPYFGFISFGVLVSVIIPQWREELTLKGVLKDIYQGYPSLSHITSIWYLLSLFIITVVFYIAYYLTKKWNKKFILWIFVALSGFFGYLITIIKKILDKGSDSAGTGGGFKMPGDRLPLTIDASMTALVFFAFGVLLLSRIIKIQNNMFCYFILTLLVNIVFGSFLNTRVNIHGCTYGNVLYFYIAALSGSAAFIFLSRMLESAKNKYIGVLKRVLVFYGRNSLFMFAMQSLLINLFFLILNEQTGEKYILFEVLPTGYAILAFVIIMLVLPLSFLLYMKLKKLVVDIGEKKI